MQVGLNLLGKSKKMSYKKQIASIAAILSAGMNPTRTLFAVTLFLLSVRK